MVKSKKYESIACSGVRTHNLKNINISFPLKQISLITGVSGSGKSSLAFSTIYAESQRRFLETLGTYERQFLQGLPQGDFDSIPFIPASIALKQNNKTADPRSTIASTLDLIEPIREVFLSLVGNICTTCGGQVTLNSKKDLLNYIYDLKQKELCKSLYLTFQMDLKKNGKKTSQSFRELLAQGFTKVFHKNKLENLQDLLHAKENVSKIQIILQRINLRLDQAELENDIESSISQVKYSSNFSYIDCIHLNDKNEPILKDMRFYVKPFCLSCSKIVVPVSNSNLDWTTAAGYCRSCNGIGNVPVIDNDKIIPNPELSLSNKVVKPWSSESYEFFFKRLMSFSKAKKIPTDKPYRELNSEQKKLIWSYRDDKNYFCIEEFFQELESEKYKSSSRILLALYRKYVTCPDCNGDRFNLTGRNIKFKNKSYVSLFKDELFETYDWFLNLEKHQGTWEKIKHYKDTYHEICIKLKTLIKLGLGSLHLFRRSKTLSGGEYQRILLSRVLGNGLSDALYILDEPSVGLGREEVKSLIECVQELKKLGNTILIVEHDSRFFNHVDNIIELGPKGGHLGGYVLPFKKKPVSSLMTKKLPILKSKERIKSKDMRKSENSIYLEGFSALNCKNQDLSLKLGALSVLTGPSGVGKTTLSTFGLLAALEKYFSHGLLSQKTLNMDQKIGTWKKLHVPKKIKESYEIVSVEQKSMHRTITSVPATLLKIMDPLRKYFASTKLSQELGFSSSDFSFNGRGGCSECRGRGYIIEDLFFLGNVDKVCEQCSGKRFRQDALQVKWKDRTISKWMETCIEECFEILKFEKSLSLPLKTAIELGLGHLPLGISTTKLSGGEAQRLKIASSLSTSKKKMICILDEPSRGLSNYDVAFLIESLLRLTQEGHSFLVIEHHDAFMEHAHVLINMGDGPGILGGKVKNYDFQFFNKDS